MPVFQAWTVGVGLIQKVYSVRVRDKGPDYRGFVQITTPVNASTSSSHGFTNPFDGPDLSPTSFSASGSTNSSIIAGLDPGGSSNSMNSYSTGQFDALGELNDASLLLATSVPSSISSSSQPLAQCFVDSCLKLNKQAKQDSYCSHIKAASHCYKNSEAVLLKSSVLNSMPIDASLKTEIWQLATATSGPLVQRVSKNIMVVKCQMDALHPLGFLHFSFQTNRLSRDNSDCGKYFCSCRSFKTSSSSFLRDIAPLQTGGRLGREPMQLRSCIHLYACIVALASHPVLASEFSQYIALVTGDTKTLKISRDVVSSLERMANTVKIQVTEDGDVDGSTAYIRVSDTGSSGEDDGSGERSFLILNDGSDHNCQVEVEVLHEDTADSFLQALDSHHSQENGNLGSGSLDDADASAGVASNIEEKLEIKLHTVDDLGVELCSSDGNGLSVRACSKVSSEASSRVQNILPLTSSGQMKREESHSNTGSPSLVLHSTQTKKQGSVSPIRKAAYPYQGRKLRDPPSESNPMITFLDWLSMVTEQINYSLQYAQPGKPPPLIYHIPKKFFDILLQRINLMGRKKISSTQTSIPHPDPSLPNFKLTRYSWFIYNLSHLKSIFNTSYVSLQATRSFLLNRNGTYQAFQPPESVLVPRTSGSSQQPHIRPHEFRTVLLVGTSSCLSTSSKPTPFIIEWTPNMLPLSKMGELRLKYEYEHIHNGHLMKNIPIKEVIPSIMNNNNNGNIPILPSPLIVTNSTNLSSSQTGVKISCSKSLPTPIAPKYILPDLKRDSAEESVRTTTVMDVALSHDTLIDGDGYATLFI